MDRHRSVLKKFSPNRNLEAGFTLIEILMSLIILGVIVGLSVPLMSTSIDAIGIHLKGVDLRESSNVAFSRMTREIRRLRDDESVVSATGSQFEFVTIEGTQIRYRLVGGTLMRSQNGNTDAGLADGVQTGGLVFTYYDDDGNGIASPQAGLGVSTDLRRIEVKITFQDGTSKLTVQTQVQPRNLYHESDLFF